MLKTPPAPSGPVHVLSPTLGPETSQAPAANPSNRDKESHVVTKKGLGSVPSHET